MTRILSFMTLAICLSWSSNLIAQTNVSDHNTLGLSHMLRFGLVRQELKLNEEQNEIASGLWVSVNHQIEQKIKTYQENFTNKLSDGEKALLKEELLAGIEEVRIEEESQIEEHFTAEQVSRLKQLRYQYLRKDSNGMESLVDDLDLSDDQISELKEVANTFKKNLGVIQEDLRNRDITPKEYRDAIADQKEQVQQALMDVLTPGQRMKLQRLEGEPFDFSGETQRNSKSNR